MKQKIVLITLVLAGAISLTIMWMGGSKWWLTSQENEHVKNGYTACQAKVETALKSPGSAKWASMDDVTIVKEDGDNYLSYSFHVDSQNGFGAMVRTRWLCHAKRSGEKWDVVKLNIIGGK